MATNYDDDLDKQALMAQLGEKQSTGPVGGALDSSGVGQAGDKSVGKVLEGAFAEGGGGRVSDAPATAKTSPNIEGVSGDVGGAATGGKAPTSTTMPVKDPNASDRGFGNLATGAANVAQSLGLGGAKGADTATPTYAPSVFQGFTPKHAMEGFDFNREQNTGKSAKDAFAYLANQAPPPPINDKKALGEWFNTNIKPGMDALGHKVNSVEGDKFNFENWQGKFDVDFGRGAGAEGGALAWQVDDPTAVLSNKAYNPQAAQSAAAQNPALLNAISGGEGGADMNAQTKAQIDALINGQTPPMDQKALLEQLGQV